ncbi:DUF6891 domain-containing protein [Aquimarina sp. LLG6339-5]|uniref:DUF6891 domain-containing protein n=1 Tax=Aquimarina sp. LLG6339-5 TaxID=3160830 RepID=UPI003869B49A
MTENEEFIYESIFNQVRMGFLSISEIKENIIEEIEDNGFEEEISKKWAFENIEQEFNRLLEESKSWKSPTDSERLIEAFDELCEKNIIALHNAGYTTSDGEYEVVEVERTLREYQVISDGYCFYHEQDLSRAITPQDSSLYITYQKVNNSDDKVTLEVGKRVAKILADKGFEIEWNEDINSKILIPNFKWQYLYDDKNRDLQNYNNVAEMIIKKQQPTMHKSNGSKSENLKDNTNNENKSWWKKLWS